VTAEPLYFTDDDAANELLAAEPLALLIGLALYQQVPVEKAFVGPAVLKERLGGSLDAASIAHMEPDDIQAVFSDKPAIHRFPASMAKRVQALSAFVAEEHGGDAASIWRDAPDAATVMKGLKQLPGFGDYKVTVAFTVLAKRFGVRPDGWRDNLADFPTVADIDGPGQLDDFKARKKAWKAS
jgi:uncharacterized HhH-GPD family protein